MQTPVIIIALTVGLAIVAVAIILMRRMNESGDTMPPSGPGTESDTQAPDPAVDEETKRKKMVVVVLALLAVGIAVAFSLANRSGGGSGDDDSFFPFLPIWIAVFVPVFLANNKKVRAKATEEQRRRIAVIIGTMMALIAAGVALALFMAANSA